MLIAAHMLAFNVDLYMGASIPALLPHVDRLYVAYPARAFEYNLQSRHSETNKTLKSAIEALNAEGKIQIIGGDWVTEEAARNACLKRAKTDGFDWLLTVDADEFYEIGTWDQIRKWLYNHPECDFATTTWYNFYKSPHFVTVDRFGSIKSTNAGFALRLRNNSRFVHKRLTNMSPQYVLDMPCYHYGYVMPDSDMQTKILTWSHAADFNVMRWYQLKWLSWTERIMNLHPTSPSSWRRAIRFPLHQPSFAQEFNCILQQPTARHLGNAIFDFQVELRDKLRTMKYIAKPFLRAN